RRPPFCGESGVVSQVGREGPAEGGFVIMLPGNSALQRSTVPGHPTLARHAGRWAAVCLVLLVASRTPCQAESQDQPKIYYSRSRTFQIPFKARAGERALRDVRLYAIEGQGQKWEPAANALPTDTSFKYSAPRDGWFWFTVLTVDVDNREFPPLDQA